MFLDTANLASPAALCAAISAAPVQDYKPFQTNEIHQPTLEMILEDYRLRQDAIKAKTKLILQGLAVLRRINGGDKDLATKAWREAIDDAENPMRAYVDFHIAAIELCERRQTEIEKRLVRAVKMLPIYEWAKGIKGIGDLSLACIIGEATGNRTDDGRFYSVGDFKSVSALWKRMGMAVINGHRQGNPGQGASANDWINEGYSKTRRSVMWNIGNSLILSMGKFRPLFGEDVRANDSYTELQKVFAERARYEAARLPHKDGTPIKESATGKESYSLHAANRAKRYVEKRLLRMLFAQWRLCMG